MSNASRDLKLSILTRKVYKSLKKKTLQSEMQYLDNCTYDIIVQFYGKASNIQNPEDAIVTNDLC